MFLVDLLKFYLLGGGGQDNHHEMLRNRRVGQLSRNAEKQLLLATLN
jgi:hypothetical protein